MGKFFLTMDFNSKYTTEDKILLDKEEEKKVTLSNDAFAIGEMIESLLNKIEQTRRSLMK